MKKSPLILFTFFVLASSCNDQSVKNSDGFTLKGEIKGQDTGKIFLSYILNNKFVHDSAIINDGHFILTGKILEPTNAELRFGNDIVSFYMESGPMKIFLNKDKFPEFKMTGSKTQNEFELLQKMEEPIYTRLSELKGQLTELNDSIKYLKNAPKILLLENKAEKIDSLWSVTRKGLDPIELKFVLDHPKSFLTPFYLRRLEEKEVISLDSVKSIFDRLDISIQESRNGKLISNDIRKKENVQIGNQAPDFIAIDLNQQTITLSQFKGNSFILLDFWASWCIPCRKSIPHLKTIYKKYHPKGLEIIAISIDEDRKQWIDAVQRDSIDMWYNIPIAENWPINNNDVCYNYYYRGVPDYILIDKDGKIIGRSNGNIVELDQLLSKVFNDKK